MTPTSDQSAASHSADFTKPWRYKLGWFLIIGGHLVLLAGLLSRFIGAGAGVVGARDS